MAVSRRLNAAMAGLSPSKTALEARTLLHSQVHTQRRENVRWNPSDAHSQAEAHSSRRRMPVFPFSSSGSGQGRNVLRMRLRHAQEAHYYRGTCSQQPPVGGATASTWKQTHRACLPVTSPHVHQQWASPCSQTLNPVLGTLLLPRTSNTKPSTSRSFSRCSSIHTSSRSGARSSSADSSSGSSSSNSSSESRKSMANYVSGSPRSTGNSSIGRRSRRTRNSVVVNSVSGSFAVDEPEAEPEEDLKLLSVRVPCPGDKADALVDCLLSFGAISCSIEDANRGTQEEEEIYGSGADPGPALWDPTSERRLWVASSVTALFPAGFDDIGLSLRLAAQAALIDNSEAMVTQALQSLSGVQGQDWVQAVKDQFQPVQVEAGFWVVPPWCTLPAEASEGAFSIVLEPGLAFGTGEHPTTGLCLRWLHDVLSSDSLPNTSPPSASLLQAHPPSAPPSRASVLDFGCGSGILSIAALKLGAERAVGIDIDPLALSSSRQNLALNSLDPASARFLLATEDCPNPLRRDGSGERGSGEASGGESEDTSGSGESGEGRGEGKDGEAKFDVVVANILLNPLLQLAGDLAELAKPGARIGLSGVLVSQVETVLKVYEKYATLQEVKDEDGWALIHLKRKE